MKRTKTYFLLLLAVFLLPAMSPKLMSTTPDTAWTVTLAENESVEEAWFSHDDSLIICNIRAHPDTGYFATYNSYTGDLVRKIMYTSEWAYPDITEISYKDTILLTYRFFEFIPDTSNVINQKITMINYMTGEIVDSLIPSQYDDDLKWDTCSIESMTFTPDYEQLFMVAKVIDYYGWDSIPVYDRKLFVWDTDDWSLERKTYHGARSKPRISTNNRYYSCSLSGGYIDFWDIDQDTIIYSLVNTDSLEYFGPTYPKADTTKFINFVYDKTDYKRKIQVRNQSDISLIKTIDNDTINENPVLLLHGSSYLLAKAGSKIEDIKGQRVIFDLANEYVVYIIPKFPSILGQYGPKVLIASNNSQLIFDGFSRTLRMYNAKYTTTSAEEQGDEPRSMLYPNPAGDYVEINNVKLSGAKHPEIKVFDILGIEHPATVWHPSEEGNLKIDVSSLSPGVYFVRVGGNMYKFVKM